jgi:hypothetical protein
MLGVIAGMTILPGLAADRMCRPTPSLRALLTRSPSRSHKG